MTRFPLYLFSWFFWISVTWAPEVLVAAEFHLSPSGREAATGSEGTPFQTLEAAARAVLESKPGPGKEPITVWIHGGRYPITNTLTLGEEFSGTQEHPIRFRAVQGEVPVFDAGLGLELSGANLVTAPAELEGLPAAGRGRAVSIVIDDQILRKALESSNVRCSLDGKMMTLSRYPNVGFGHVHRVLDKGVVYAHGRTKGNPPKWSLDQPIGGRFTFLDKDVTRWERELQRVRKLRVIGYPSYDWYRENHPVAGVTDGTLQIADYSRYGILDKRSPPRRLIATNLLCELDAPGEFYFDAADSTLFFIPPDRLHSGSTLSIWGGPGLVQVQGASYLAIEGIVVEGVGKGRASILVESGRHVSLAGCTIRNSSRPAVVIAGGTHNGLLSCDIYDVAQHLTLGGGDVRTLTPAHNFAKNCHFTQVAAGDYYGGIRVTGVGNTIRHCLVHNCPGQIMTFGDCDHLIENNEFFNIGYEEGDGGAIYSGAARWSWGNVLRHNFLHHLMCLPQAHPRGGIYPDDGDQGETIEGNVFYKAAHRAVLINGGAGHKVRDNLFLEGYIGIYNTEAWADQGPAKLARYDSGELKRGDKDDWVWRTEQVVGREGWNKEPWASRFPVFRKIMNQEKRRHYPIECVYTGNRFSGNWRNIEHRIGSGPTGVKPVEQAPFIRSEDNLDIDMSVFADPSSLDFRPRARPGDPPVSRIPFAEIGLRKDAYRTVTPDKAHYRAAVRKHFAKRPSYNPKGVYDPKTINGMVYFNTGRLLLNGGGMIHADR